MFLDLGTAYEKVRKDRLVVTLMRHGMPLILIQLISQLMFCAAKFALIVNGDVSASFLRNMGRLQGSSLSASIFTIFIYRLVQNLNSTTEPGSVIPSCLFVANDSVVLRNPLTNAAYQLNQYQRWAIWEGIIRFTTVKCVVLSSEIIHHVGHDPLQIDGIDLPVVSF